MIGEGGFGRVYRARLEGGDGFYKDVAIKLLKEDVPPGILERFRDEARILGLLRDRAIVSVDPPVKLGGRWAVVMEFVDGASAARIVKHVNFPLGPALELVEEVSRSLAKLYRHPGTDGAPLHLIHRDLKPGNLQLTPSGEVKILDFGIARAEFTDREAHTTIGFAGTMGYIAPERMSGIDGPAGDVFSLGVVLHKLVTGDLPKGRPAWTPEAASEAIDDPLERVLRLSDRLRAEDPDHRPPMKDVPALCHALRESLGGGELLRDWAERIVPGASVLPEDELVGNTLSEATLKAPAPAPEVDQPPPPVPPIALAAGIGIALGLTVGGFALVGWSLSRNPPQEPVAQVQPLPAPAPVAEPPPSPPVEIASDVPPAPAAPAPEVPAAPAVAPAPSAAPAPEAAPPVQVAVFPITISSVPLGATVRIDGAEVGRTPLTRLELPGGEHAVVLQSGDKTTEQTIRVGRRLAARFLWHVDTDEWEAGG